MSTNSAPFEIIAQPFTLWIAPTGTAFPSVEDEPADPWLKLGTSGDLNYDEGGVNIKHSQKLTTFKSLGSTGARKVFRTEEELKIALKLCDVSLEQYKRALNDNTVTEVPGVGHAGGYKKIGLSRGLTVTVFALLVRGHVSPYGDDWNMQYEVPVAYQSGEPDPIGTKGKAMELAMEFEALEDPSASSADEKFGRLIAQNEDPPS